METIVTDEEVSTEDLTRLGESRCVLFSKTLSVKGQSQFSHIVLHHIDQKTGFERERDGDRREEGGREK